MRLFPQIILKRDNEIFCYANKKKDLPRSTKLRKIYRIIWIARENDSQLFYFLRTYDILTSNVYIPGFPTEQWSEERDFLIIIQNITLNITGDLFEKCKVKKTLILLLFFYMRRVIYNLLEQY